MRSGVHPVIADMIVGHGNLKKDVQSLYISISDADLVDAIDRMELDNGETEISVSEHGNGKLPRKTSINRIPRLPDMVRITGDYDARPTSHGATV